MPLVSLLFKEYFVGLVNFAISEAEGSFVLSFTIEDEENILDEAPLSTVITMRIIVAVKITHVVIGGWLKNLFEQLNDSSLWYVPTVKYLPSKALAHQFYILLFI